MIRPNTWLLAAGWFLAMPAAALDVEGELAWGQRLEISTTVSGPVARLHVVPGQRVEAGTSLLELDQRMYQARLDQARAGLEYARQNRDEAQLELERAEELYDRTVLSDHDLTLARIGLATAEATRRKAAAALTEARLELEFSRVQAPFSGVVLAVLVAPGQAVANRLRAQPLLVLADDRYWRALGEVDADMAASLAPGAAAQVAVGGRWFDGEVTLVGREPLMRDAKGPRYRIEVSFAAVGEDNLRAGQSVRLRINE